MSYCAPKYQSSSNANVGGSNSCLTLNALRKIASAYNQTYPHKAIKNISSMNRNQLWKLIHERLGDICKENNNETCWIEQDFVSSLGDSEIYGSFKPIKPKGKHQWLSTADIHDVMEQYEEKYPDFSFLGPVPINHSELSDRLVDEVNHLDLREAYKQGIRKIGIVFNLSPWLPHQTNSGSHWVALWIDMNKRIFAYFDSFGCESKPNQCIPPQVQSLLSRLKSQIPGFKTVVSRNNMQRDNSECGVYAMYFLVSALEGRDIEGIFNDIKRDEEINKYRNIFFRPSYRELPAVHFPSAMGGAGSAYHAPAGQRDAACYYPR